MIDLSSLISKWWPKAPWQELSTAAKLATWLLLVDDSLDQGDVNSDAAQHDTYMIETLIGETLGLYEKQSGCSSRNTMFQRFVDPGQMVRSAYTHDQLMRLFDEIKMILRSQRMEKTLKMRDQLPSCDEYWKYRSGTNLMGAVCAMTEYAYCIRVPNEVMEHDSMKNLWHWTNMVVAYTNDILSLPKEVAQGEVNSLIPILFLSMNHNLKDAVDAAVQQLQEAINQFHQAQQLLREQFPDNHEIAIIIDTFYDYCAGFMDWSFATPRYGVISKSVQPTGHISQVLHVKSR